MNPNYVRKKEEVISFIVLVVVLLVPVGNFIYGIMQAIYVGRRISFENNKEDKKLALWKLDNNFEYDNRLKGLCTGFEQFYKLLSENRQIII